MKHDNKKVREKRQYDRKQEQKEKHFRKSIILENTKKLKKTLLQKI